MKRNAFYGLKHCASILNIRTMDNNIKQKIDDIVNEIGNIKDLNIKHAVLTYMEQQAGFMLWQMEDEKHIDNDSYNV